MLHCDAPILIVGAGASGLVSASALESEGFTNITIVERRADIGGVWLFDDDYVSTSNHKLFPSPMYDNLVGNIWKKLLELDDHKFGDDVPEFPDRRQMQQYLKDYAKRLKALVKTHTNVIAIDKVDRGWSVNTEETDDLSSSKTSFYRAVILACGIYDNPDTPEIPGLQQWQRERPADVIHSKYYRTPKIFANQRMLVLGNGPSGIDIAAQSASYAKTPIYRAIHGPAEHAVLPDERIIDVSAVSRFEISTRSAHLIDGTTLTEIDRIVISTGYRHSYPFLKSLNSSSHPLVTNGNRIHNLYKHIFYRPDPTLCFIGLLIAAIPFPISEAQALTAARVLSGRLSLPDDAEMKADEQQRLNEVGDTYKFHKMRYPLDANYGDSLYEWCLTASPRKEHEKLPVSWTAERRLWRRQNLEKKMVQLRRQRDGEDERSKDT